MTRWRVLLVAVTAAVTASNLWAQSTNRIGAVPGQFDMIKVQAPYLYASAGRTLTVFDVSDPAAIRKVGAYTLPEEIWAFRVAGNEVYLGTNFAGVSILDVSNPARPVLKAAYKTRGQAKTASPFGTKVIVVDHMEGLVLVDVSTPSTPMTAASFFVDGYARDVVTVGPLAYAVDSPTGFYVLDLSKPGPLEPVATLQSGTALRTIEIMFGEDGRTPRAAVMTGGGTVQLYDLANPRAPVKAGTLRTPGGAVHVALDGSRGYVADGREGVAIVDLSSLAEPRLVSSFMTPMPARDVAVSRDMIFVATGAQDCSGEVIVLRETR